MTFSQSQIISRQQWRRGAYASLLLASCATSALMMQSAAAADTSPCPNAQTLGQQPKLTSSDGGQFNAVGSTAGVGVVGSSTQCNVYAASQGGTIDIQNGGKAGNVILDDGILTIRNGGQLIGYAAAGEFYSNSDNGTQGIFGKKGTITVAGGGLLGAGLIGPDSTLTVGSTAAGAPKAQLGWVNTSGTTIIQNADVDSRYADDQGGGFSAGAITVNGGTTTITGSTIQDGGATTTGRSGKIGIAILPGGSNSNAATASDPVVTIENTTIKDVGTGVLVNQGEEPGGKSSTLHITNSHITANIQGAISVMSIIPRPAASNIVTVSDSTLIGVRGVDMMGGATSASIDFKAGNTIITAAGTGATSGVKVQGTAEGTFTTSTKITGITHGVELRRLTSQDTSPGARVTLSDNSSAVGQTGAAILVDAAVDAQFTLASGSTLQGANNRLLDVVNKGEIQFIADTVTLTGDMVADADSSMNIALQKSTVMNGNITLGDTVEVSGDSIWTVAGSSSAKHLIVGGTDKGVVTLGGTASFSSDNAAMIARDAGSTGILNIGAAPNDAAADPGAFAVPSVTFGQGDGAINFNHTSSGYLFGAAMSGKGTVNQINGKTVLTGDSTYTGATTIAAGSTLQLGNGGETGSITSDVTNAGNFIFNRSNDLNYGGKISGDGVFEQIGTGKAVLGGDSSDFTGESFVRSGILAVNGTLGGTMDVVAGRLQGIGSVGSTTHEAGATIMPGNGGFETLTIKGDYIGKGGTVEIATVLGDDNSQTSRLAITGSTSGAGIVKVTNRDGLGAMTKEGIRIISVGGTSDAAFTLQGDFITKAGEQAVVGGAYAYMLQKNGVANSNDGAWYLRSQLKNKEPSCEDTGTCPPKTPHYNPGTPIYEGYGQTMQALNKLPTLQQRVGNRYWSGAANPVIEQGADALGTPLVPADAAIDAHGIWGRIEGAHNRFEANRSTSAMKQDVDTFIMQAGVDGQFYEGESGKLIGGITGQYGKANSKITSDHGDGKIDTHGWGLGGTLTWYGDNGFYADAQAQAMWYDSDLNSITANQSLTNGNKGFGYGLSLEAGKRIDLDASWSLTPQAQLVWSSVKFDTFDDAWGASVSNRNGDSLNARLGLSADYRNAWRDSRGMINRSHIYGIVNLYREFMSGNKVTVAGVDFKNENDKTWGGIGAGGSYAWADDKYAFYGEGSLNTSLSNFADSYAVKGTVGFRVKW